tara:strand:- start:526 stop:717 length:192 start_codon:yes stop_codon:yes gene_type:complete
VFIDLFSRRVVGWSMGSRMKARLVTDALRMAIWRWSIWVNGNWRMTFEFQDGNAYIRDYEDYH